MSESYSQYGEDLIIAELFPDLNSHHNLIDIGAFEPRALSNSRLLIERGWDATLIEFSPHPLRNLVKEYNGNPNVRVIAAAVTPQPQHVTKFRMTDDAISSDQPDTEFRWARMRPGYDGGFYGDLWVPTISVKALVDQFYGDKPIHFVSVDTEGSSVEIAVEFMKLEHSWKPQVLCVEYDDKLVYLLEQAQVLQYRQAHINGVNVILARK